MTIDKHIYFSLEDYAKIKIYCEENKLSFSKGVKNLIFHGIENKKFHDQLSLKVCEKLVPLVEELLQCARDKGEIHFDDLRAAAMFCVYGQLGILLADDLTQEDKAKKIRKFLIFALHL